MKKFILLTMLLFLLADLSGCANKGQEQDKILKDNQQLQEEVAALKLQISDMSQENEEFFMLRDLLDNNLYKTLRALVMKDYVAAKMNLASNVKVDSGNVLFKVDAKENIFLIPGRQMNLRQRTFMLQKDGYYAIYEIYDSGYKSGEYNDRINTLNVTYKKENGHWLISNIMIDE